MTASDCSVGAAALRLASCGLAVFPVGGDCRSPLIKQGVYGAEKAAQGVQSLWRAHPDANVAVACGAVSGVFVLDVDVKAGGDGRASLRQLIGRHGELPRSWASLTPSGGCHLWFNYAPGLRNRVGFVPGLDCRTDGGSVCAPPSTRRDGLYRWARSRTPWECELQPAPMWLLAIIAPPEPPRRPPPPLRVGSFDRAARYIAAAVEGECAEVASLKPGGRNARLFQAAARLGALPLPSDLALAHLENAAEACGLTREDGLRSIRATIASGLRRGRENPREVLT